MLPSELWRALRDGEAIGLDYKPIARELVKEMNERAAGEKDTFYLDELLGDVFLVQWGCSCEVCFKSDEIAASLDLAVGGSYATK